MSVTFTTELPDDDQPVLGNGVEDEVAVGRESAPTNYGDVRIQIRETGMTVWDGRATGFDEQVVAFDDLTATFTGREDGEAYEVRLRSETEHVVGSWTEPVAITTKFPGAANPTAGDPTTTSVEVSWTDNSDNEDGFDLQHRRQYDSGPGPWETVATVDPNVTSATDDELVPGETYDLRIRAFTEDAEAVSNPTTVTADSLDIGSSRAPARGYRVEIDHPDGQTVVPDLRDDPEFRPSLNDLPRISIPVRRADHWLSQNWEGVPIRVWCDGDRLPIDELDSVEPSPDGVVLEAVGGGELRDRVTQSYQQKEAWLAVRDDLLPQTSYGAHVDDPADGGGTESEVQSATTTSAFQERLKNPLATDPLLVDGGQVTTAQTCWPMEGENRLRNGGNIGFGSGSQYSSGQILTLNSAGDYAEWEFTPAYDMPADAVGLQVLDDANDTPGITWSVAGVEVDSLPQGAQQLSLGWSDVGSGTYSLTAGYDGPLLSAGETYVIRVECTASSSGESYYIDMVAPYDTRYSYNWAEETGANGYLPGPQTKPDAFEVVFESAPSPFNIPSGSLDVAMDNTGGEQALALTNDNGATWTSASNTSSIDATFASGGSSIGARVTLGRYGSRTDQTPTQGFRGQTLDSYSLSAVLENSPVLIKTRYDDSLLSVLQSIADYGDFVFELRWSSEEDRIVVEWTQSGQRTASSDPPLSDYSVSKQIGAAYDRAIIYGAAQPVDGESVTADHGTAVALDEDVLVEASETVRDPQSGASYVRGSDYELDSQDGTLTALAGGSISDGQELAVSYEHKFRGSYTRPDAPADPRTTVKTVASITSDQGCDIAALFLIQRVGEPLFSASIEVPRRALGLDLVSAQTVAELPTDEAMEIWSIDESPSTARLQLGTRREVEEVVSDLQDRVSASAERV